jgi:hypothetical protein
MKPFPVGAGIPLGGVVGVDEQISELDVIRFNEDRGLRVYVFGEEKLVVDDDTKRSIADAWVDNGDHIPIFIDQITGIVKDVQDSRMASRCQPVNDRGREGTSMDRFHSRVI